MTKGIIHNPGPEAERVDPGDGTPKIGQYYWVTHASEWDIKRYGKTELACVTEVGSNYATVKNVGGSSWRVHFDEWDETCEYEPNPELHIRRKVEHHRGEVRRLMGEVAQLTAGLGIQVDRSLDSGEPPTQALAAASGTADIKAHKNALIKAQKETLPELFKEIKDHHESMAIWMKFELAPMLAVVKQMKDATNTITDRIFTVELYAGLVEEVIQITDGRPAAKDEKIRLFQCRHYMDEECLARYEAGGMAFANIDEFDRWLARPANRDRILPHPRSIVAFQVRRNDKERECDSISDFFRILNLKDADKLTFLYIRNGEQMYCLRTGIEFEEQLFPDVDRDDLLDGNQNLYVDSNGKVISQREWDSRKQDYQEQRDGLARKIWDWRRTRVWDSKGNRWEPLKPGYWYGDRPEDRTRGYVPVDRDTVYYDDAMKKIRDAANRHNRVAVVLQGLLDRSPALNPHPPWKLWTADGFTSAIELVYDDSRAITSGDPPDFEAYRARLNASLKVGDYTVGQDDAWAEAEAKKECERRNRDWRSQSDRRPRRYRPYGNPGPGDIAKVVRKGRNGLLHYEWERERVSWRRESDDPITVRFACPASRVLNVSAYTPGDFHQFYDDPRTRADYLKWAPLLLAAEDFHAGKWPRKVEDEETDNG